MPRLLVDTHAFLWFVTNSLLFNLAFFHLMTLSGLASTFGAIVRPICLAAFRLITNSNKFNPARVYPISMI